MTLRSILALLGSLVFAVTAYAGDNELPHVLVYGTAVTRVVPDQMVWRLTVQNKGSKLPPVAEEHTKIVSQVLTFLDRIGIEKKETQTGSMQFGVNWEYKGNSWVREGYYASTVVSFRTSDLTSHKPLWLGLSEISGVTVDSVSYDHSKRITFQNETRRRALIKAKEKALDLATILGSEIGEPLLIEEEDVPDSDETKFRNEVSKKDSSGSSTDMAPGRIPIRMRVKVSFRLMTPTE